MVKTKTLFCILFAFLVLTSFVGAQENHAPVFFAVPAIPASIIEGNSHVFGVQVHDPDGDVVIIEWYLDDILVSTADEYNFTAVSAGVYTIQVIISDGELNNSIEFPVFVEMAPDTAPLTIDIIMPADGSTVKGDFTSLIVETDEDAVCEFSLGLIGPNYGGASRSVEMEITGENFHMQSIENLHEIQEDEHYKIWVTCSDEFGNSDTASISFYVDLSELREVMILEDIGDYKYEKSAMFEVPEGEDDEITAMYFVYYDKDDDNIYSVSLIEFEDSSLIEESLEEVVDAFGLVIQNINGQNIYVSNDEDLQYTTWTNGRFIISVMVFSLEVSQPIPLSLAEAYLEKYPSDLEVESDEFLILEIKTIDHNLIEFNFLDLAIETNQISTCFIKLNDGNFEKVDSSGAFFHHLDDYILEEGENLVTIKCENSFGETDEKYLTKKVDLTNLKEKMILENIGGYEFGRTYMRTNIGEEGISTEYEAEYYNNIDGNFYDVEIYDVINISLFEQIIEEIQGFLSPQLINGQEVYFLDEGDGDYGIIWIHENLIVGISVNNFGEEKPSFSQLAEAYLEKYPSDLPLDKTPPAIELISPKDDYTKRTSKSSYEIDFKFKVSDESEIVSCNLIIDGEIEDTDTNILKGVENIFSKKLKKGSYDWQIKCVDSEGNEGFSEIRDLRIKKKKKSSDDSYYETLETTPTIDEVVEEPEVIILNPKTSEKSEGFFESIINWFKSLFGWS